MAQTLQHRRNTTTGLQTERGSEGEIFMDTTKKTLVVMDGVTNGGTPLAKEADIPTAVSELTNDVGYITSSSVFSGVYADLTNKPTLFDGQYSSLSGIPSTFTPASHNQDFSTITNTPTTISGYGITDAFVQGSSEIEVGNTHTIFAISDTILGLGPNNFRIDFGTSLQNWANLENADVIRLKPDTELRIILADGSDWGFGTGGGIDFPDFTTQTTAYTGPQTSISGEAGSDLELSSNNDVNINTSVGNENHVFEFKGDGTFYMAKNPIGNTSIISTPRNDYNANLNLASALDVIITSNEASGSLENWTFKTTGALEFPDGSTQTTAWPGSVSFVGNGTSFAYVPIANGNIVFSVNSEIPVAVIDEDGLVINKIISGAISGMDLTITTDYNSNMDLSGDILIDADDQATSSGVVFLGSQSGKVSIGRTGGGETDIYGNVEFNNGNTFFQSGQTVTINTTDFYVNEIHGRNSDDLVLTGGASDGSVIINGDGTGQVQIDQVAGGGVWIGKTDGTGADIQTYSRLQVRRGIINPYQSKVNATGVVVHDCDDGHLFYHLNPAADWTVNLTNFRSFNTMSTTITLVVEQGVSSAYLPLTLQIAGSAQTIKWLNNSDPSGTVNKTDIVTFTIFDKSTGYNVLGECRTYG
jgi:hypothetical protein